MTEQWGAPLTGALMKLLRAAGLPDGTRVRLCGTSCVVEELTLDSFFSDYELPAHHPAYTLLNAGWLDGRNVRLWNGGETAPDDLADGSTVLLQGGQAYQASEVTYWEWDGDSGDIIAYIAKDEVMESEEPDTVTIAKMTPDEIMESFNIPADEHQRSAFGRGAWIVLELLGLIKPDQHARNDSGRCMSQKAQPSRRISRNGSRMHWSLNDE